jgi:uncharacterized protein (UPF0332 family)
MTDAGLRAIASAEAERGDQALAASEKLLAAGLFYDAASRAYYAAFPYARALCLVAGEEPRSHQGVAHLLSLHFVRTGVLPEDTSRTYALLQRFRESSDYDAAFVLDEPGADEAVRSARELRARFRALLIDRGLIPGKG